VALAEGREAFARAPADGGVWAAEPWAREADPADLTASVGSDVSRFIGAGRRDGVVGSVSRKVKVGSKIRVKKSVSAPRYGWCGANHKTIGIVQSINGTPPSCDIR
jgi:hypothetical protein